MTWIVCAWHTPDYLRWAAALVASLEAARAPYDVLEVEKWPGGWEANTRRKAEMLLTFMDRHPGKAIILVDADAEVNGDLSALAELPSDISMCGRLKQKFGAAFMQWCTGTVVVRPTDAAKAFLQRWLYTSKTASYGEDDQSTLVRALLLCGNLSIGVLDERWLAGAQDGGPHIRHQYASDKRRKVSPFLRVMDQWRRRFARVA